MVHLILNFINSRMQVLRDIMLKTKTINKACTLRGIDNEKLQDVESYFTGRGNDTSLLDKQAENPLMLHIFIHKQFIHITWRRKEIFNIHIIMVIQPTIKQTPPNGVSLRN